MAALAAPQAAAPAPEPPAVAAAKPRARQRADLCRGRPGRPCCFAADGSGAAAHRHRGRNCVLCDADGLQAALARANGRGQRLAAPEEVAALCPQRLRRRLRVEHVGRLGRRPATAASRGCVRAGLLRAPGEAQLYRCRPRASRRRRLLAAHRAGQGVRPEEVLPLDPAQSAALRLPVAESYVRGAARPGARSGPQRRWLAKGRSKQRRRCRGGLVQARQLGRLPPLRGRPATALEGRRGPGRRRSRQSHYLQELPEARGSASLGAAARGGASRPPRPDEGANPSFAPLRRRLRPRLEGGIRLLLPQRHDPLLVGSRGCGRQD